jgi:hypothetical protein
LGCGITRLTVPWIHGEYGKVLQERQAPSAEKDRREYLGFLVPSARSPTLYGANFLGCLLDAWLTVLNRPLETRSEIFEANLGWAIHRPESIDEARLARAQHGFGHGSCGVIPRTQIVRAFTEGRREKIDFPA